MEEKVVEKTLLTGTPDTRPVNLDAAIDMVGFGKFHHFLLFVCGSLFASIAISLTSVSFIMPSAQCDLEMTSVHKGLLNGTTMMGMFLGSFIWGYVADSMGRRHALIFSMLMDSSFNLLSSVSQIYPIFLFCRLMSGFGVSGATVLYSYLGEFVNNKYRGKCLCWMEMFWTGGIIILPCIAWMIIPLTFRFEYGFFLFKSWNLFTIVCSLSSLILVCVLMKLPESPKFLLSKGKHDETIESLKFVYLWNNNTDDKFPVTSVVLPDYVDELSKGFFRGLYDSTLRVFTSKFKVVAIITCIIQFCSTTSYYMLILWFPEMMNRFRWYETVYEGPLNKTSMCEVMSLHKVELKESLVMCNDEIDIDVYINIIIIGIACIPTSLVLPLFVNKLGLRILLLLCFFGSGVAVAFLYFITSSFENLVLSAVFEALSSAGISLVFCITVELFPTEYRAMSMSLGSMCGKIGAIMGNIIVGVFIDAHCLIPILLSCSFLFISGLLVFTLPKTRTSDTQ